MMKKWLDKITGKRVTNIQKIKPDEEYDRLIGELLGQMGSQTYSLKFSQFPAYGEMKKLKPRARAEFVHYLLFTRLVPMKKKIAALKNERWKHVDYNAQKILSSLLEALLRMKLDFEEGELVEIFGVYREMNASGDYLLEFSNWPLGFTVIQMEKHAKAHGLTDSFRSFIEDAISWPEFDGKKGYYGSDPLKAKARLMSLVHDSDSEECSAPAYEFVAGDVFCDDAQELTNGLTGGLAEAVNEMYHLAVTASQGKPTQKWIKASKAILKKVDAGKYKMHIRGLLEILLQKEPAETLHTSTYNGREYTYSTHVFLHERNALLVKGLVWSLSQYHDQKTLDSLARLAERSFKKIPGVGPTCAGVGNACIYTLASSKGLAGLSHLTRLKLRVTQNNTRKLIQKYIEEASIKLGITPAALEEMAVPDFGLVNCGSEFPFDDYSLKLSVVGTGKTKLEWFTPEGKLQKSVPAFVKASKKHSDQLKKIRAQAKQIQKYSSAQRDRIDRSYVDDRSWSYEDFFRYYHNHGLVGYFSKRLIWIFTIDGEMRSGLWNDGVWLDQGGEELYHVHRASEVKLWHPILVSEDEVLAWRDRLDEWKIQQPMKQAYREVYILTDAEVNTRTYSNRMAAHLLKQHQLNALAGLRGWKYSLLGAYDDGRDGETATLALPAHDLTAEYWINEIHADDAWNDAGIYDYVATDQVRFTKAEGDVVDLMDIPALVFSEIMRDVDLFVGVCSVGNDPEWNDRGGIAEYRGYWETYSFGNLTELALTRKSILERLIPRLKHSDLFSIDGKFLRVKGKVREYKIHIGSTNILMEPNDQYLCIVPARGAKDKTNKVFLPFEGDRGLSLVLSKAALLVEDDKITDSTILSQIKRS